MAKQPSTADATTQELIVAYLDDELSPAETARVEKRLAEDAKFREQLRQLEQTWAALDELPSETVDDRFSRTTMELVVMAAEQDVLEKTTALPVVKRKRRVSNWLLIAAAALLGFAMFRLAWTSPNRQLLASLPVVMHVDAYTQFRDVEFLKLLSEKVDLVADLSEEEQSRIAEQANQLASFNDFDARKTWLAKLDKQQRTDLRYKAIRFRELPEVEQQRLSQLHEAVASAKLESTLIAYETWLDGLSEAKQYELRSISDPVQRVRTVNSWREEAQADAKFALNEQQLRDVVEASREFYQFFRRMRQQGRRDASSEDRRKRAALMIEKSQQLLAALPEPVRSEYQKLSFREKVAQVMLWRRQATAFKGGVSETELERFFTEELPVERREELLSLSPEDMQRRLRELYHRQTGMGFDGSPEDGPPMDGPPHEGPPRDRRDRRGEDPHRDDRPRRGPPRDQEFRRGPPPPDGERFGPPPRDR